MRTFLSFYLLFQFTFALSQHSDSIKPPVTFGRLTGNAFMGTIQEKRYGRSFYAFGKTYFMDETIPLNNRRYLRVGLFYNRFEKYCKKKGIAYNKKELRIYRRKAVLSGFIFGMACFGFFPVAIDAEINAQRTGIYNWPQMYFNSPRAPVFWSLPVVEGIVAVKLRSAAERRLRDSVFNKGREIH